MTIYLDELDLVKHIETPLNQLFEENPESGNALVWNDTKCKSRIIQRIQDAQLYTLYYYTFTLCIIPE
jgi:hypothetical protein